MGNDNILLSKPDISSEPTTATTVANGANVVEGSTGDAANTTGASGTISGKLRGLVSIFADVWISASHFLSVGMANILMASQDSIVSSDGIQPNNTALTPYSTRISTNTTTTPTSNTAYVSSISICVETVGTTSTIDIRDKAGTPVYLVRSLATTAIPASGNFVFNFQKPVLMTSGIDIITAGGGAAVLGVKISYY
jgi:hypothetical protein